MSGVPPSNWLGPNNNSEDEVEEETLEEENNDNTTSILSVRRVDFVEPAKSSTFVPLGEQPMYKQFFIKVKDTLALIPVRCARNETSDLINKIATVAQIDVGKFSIEYVLRADGKVEKITVMHNSSINESMEYLYGQLQKITH